MKKRGRPKGTGKPVRKAAPGRKIMKAARTAANHRQVVATADQIETAEDTLAAYLSISANLSRFSKKARMTILRALHEKFAI